MRQHLIGMTMVAVIAGSVAAATREREAMDRVEADLGRLERELMVLQARHFAAKSEDKPVLKAQIEQKTAEREKLFPTLHEAILKTYRAEPAPDELLQGKIMDTLLKHVKADRWEEAYDCGQAMAEKNHPDKRVKELAGIAAFQSNNFAAAEKLLGEAKAAGTLSPDGARFLPMSTAYKAYWSKELALRDAEAKTNDLPRIRFETTAGTIEIELFENQAPGSVANFVHLVGAGFFDGTVFHRVIPGFMAQGGDPTGTGRGGPGWSIKCECYREDFRRHFRGTLSMAHAGRDTGGSQFFLTFVPTSHLDGKHTAFGRVADGMANLSKIVREPGGGKEPTKIIKATVLRKRNYDYVPEKLPARR